MKKLLLYLLTIAIALWSIPAIAEEFNIDQYSYEELKSMVPAPVHIPTKQFWGSLSPFLR
jgi:hypothetical protein